MKAYAAAEATAKKRLIARVVISDARNRGLRRGPGLEAKLGRRPDAREEAAGLGGGLWPGAGAV